MMNTEAMLFLHAAIVGLGATLFMDLWALFLHRAFGVAPSNYCLVGRWICHMPEGRFMHASISAAAHKSFECAAGWIAHYVIGAAYALGFVAIVSAQWLALPTLWPALLFGIATVLVPYLIMQPSFGFGIAASKTPNPALARLKSLMAHVAYGVGLCACAAGLSYLLPVQT